jgi:hypothetical protein
MSDTRIFFLLFFLFFASVRHTPPPPSLKYDGGGPPLDREGTGCVICLCQSVAKTILTKIASPSAGGPSWQFQVQKP